MGRQGEIFLIRVDFRLKLNKKTNKKNIFSDLFWFDDKISTINFKLRASDINSTRILFDELAEQIAREHDLLNHGQVGELIGHYLFTRRPDEESTELREFQAQR